MSTMEDTDQHRECTHEAPHLLAVNPNPSSSKPMIRHCIRANSAIERVNAAASDGTISEWQVERIQVMRDEMESIVNVLGCETRAGIAAGLITLRADIDLDEMPS